jgi:phage baseplate assembly protein W
MATYIGYSTQEVNQRPETSALGALPTKKMKKFTLTDSHLVMRDLMNALSIKQGDKVGNPSYGTTIWSYVFEPNTQDVRQEMEAEMRRVIAQDPRIIVNTMQIYPFENGIQFEIELAFNPFNEATTVGINLNRNTGKVTQTS